MRNKSLLLTFLAILTFVACSDKSEETKAKVSVNAKLPATALSQNIAVAPPVTPPYEASLNEGIQFGEKPGYPSFIKSVSGMSKYEEIGRWTEGAKATFTFVNPLPTIFKLRLEMGRAFGPNLGKPVKVNIGDWKGEFTIEKPEAQTFALNIKTSQPAESIEFIIPDPQSPAELKMSSDPRPLGILFKRLSIQK
jgi:hypothetical protein